MNSEIAPKTRKPGFPAAMTERSWLCRALILALGLNVVLALGLFVHDVRKVGALLNQADEAESRLSHSTNALAALGVERSALERRVTEAQAQLETLRKRRISR